jgi:opacity protein-like surface antigen
MHMRILTVAALALPAALSAQQAAAPQQPPANPITTAFKTSGARYAGWLTAAFDSIPASKYGYKPTPVQQSVGYVAQHLEGANYQLCSRFGGPAPTMTARDSLADTVKAAWPKDTLTTRLKASFARTATRRWRRSTTRSWRRRFRSALRAPAAPRRGRATSSDM